MRALLGCLVLFLALAGCSSTVYGHGTVNSAPPRTTLSCAPGAVTATSAPFCFPLPAGFSDFTSKVPPEPKWTYQAIVSVAQHDLIEVVASSIGRDTDTDTDAKLAERADQLRIKTGQFETSSAGGLVPLQVDGARAFEQSLRYTSGVGARSILVYRGRTELRIACQFLEHGAEVQDACTRVIDTIQVVGLPH